jgi:hypothetical protein
MEMKLGDRKASYVKKKLEHQTDLGIYFKNAAMLFLWEAICFVRN